MKTIEIRELFIQYFKKNKHKMLKQSNIVIDDPTLFFVNAGMNQLKSIFLGEKPINPKYTRLVNSQICVRAGGKHNDLDEVGKDSYHLTSFEMLGNWSLNDYGKEEAIDLAYHFLTDICHLDKNRMYVTFFGGNDDIPADDETKTLWKKYFPESRIISSSFKDNFWMMGATGPCGACTEIHYDIKTDITERPEIVNANDPTLIEIWNLVFIQYNKTATAYEKLDKLFVDTGLGSERISMVINNKKSLYETDALNYIISYAQILSRHDPYVDSYDEKALSSQAYRIFADHMRTTIIAQFQEIKFDSHNRGAVLKKIFKRALTHYYLYLNNYTISPIMHRQPVLSLITDILDYMLFFTHDNKLIQQNLITEEKLYLGALNHVKTTYTSYLKTMSHPDAITKLKTTDGIDPLIIENLSKLKFYNPPSQLPFPKTTKKE
ncbi:MAG: alanyl-tRNA synthetase [Harvfovirus sp.]|uniref:alanine--tRNA ligase n=1 Tax=Harvfovirus sp. TaxID=2487768 RepID=A0A3G5A3W4_9VIRU|nr:MAG: alanyl-tRNA synthetase [Harvfovirus sp.]